MRTRRAAEQWQEILARQREAGLTDAQAAVENDVSVSGLRLWRQRLKKLSGPQPLVEVTPLLPRGELKVHLPNGLILGVSGDWPMDQLAAVVRQLRAL
jgi:hypothetical protein